MSAPVMICRFKKALTDKEAFDALVRDMAFNFTQRAYSITECEHHPKCPPLTKEEESSIKKQVLEAVHKEHNSPNGRFIY